MVMREANSVGRSKPKDCRRYRGVAVRTGPFLDERKKRKVTRRGGVLKGQVLLPRLVDTKNKNGQGKIKGTL